MRKLSNKNGKTRDLRALRVKSAGMDYVEDTEFILCANDERSTAFSIKSGLAIY